MILALIIGVPLALVVGLLTDAIVGALRAERLAVVEPIEVPFDHLFDDDLGWDWPSLDGNGGWDE